MGYDTDFYGAISIDKPLDEETANYLIRFSETRRMARNLPPEYGVEGEYYVDGRGFAGQEHEDNIINYNQPPKTQPGLWCKWIPSDDRKAIVWDEGEKFYKADEWMMYIIDNFLAPKGYVCNGTIEAQGEEVNDHWWIKVTNNKVESLSLEDVIQKAEAFDVLMTKQEELPLLVGTNLSNQAKTILQMRLDGTLKISLKD